MKYLNHYLEFSKLYRSEIKNTKTFLLIIVVAIELYFFKDFGIIHLQPIEN